MNHAMSEPIQLPLFPETAALTRIRPERNEWRYYRLEVWPDLFGRALLRATGAASAPRDACALIRTRTPEQRSTPWSGLHAASGGGDIRTWHRELCGRHSAFRPARISFRTLLVEKFCYVRPGRRR